MPPGADIATSNFRLSGVSSSSSLSFPLPYPANFGEPRPSFVIHPAGALLTLLELEHGHLSTLQNTLLGPWSANSLLTNLIAINLEFKSGGLSVNGPSSQL